MLQRASAFCSASVRKGIFALILLLTPTYFAHAALYAPGATLDPACAPTDTNCGVATSTIASGTTGQVPYYAASGTSLSATSSLTFFPSGSVGLVAGSYLNWGSSDGSAGYGFRDNGGTIQIKNSGGSWANIPTSGTTQWTTSGSDIFYTTGNVGIGTTSPFTRLAVAGAAYVGGNLTATGTLAVLGTGTSTFSTNIAITGNIVPTANDTYSLGDASHQWKDLFVGPGSIYVNGQEVLHTDPSQNVNVSANLNQDLVFLTSGTGDVQLNPSGTGVVYLKGNVIVSGGKTFNTSDNSALAFTDGIKGGNVQVSDNSIAVSNTNGSLSLSANGVGVLYVPTSSVGIGTTSPLAKLDVYGNAVISGTDRYLNFGAVSGSSGYGLRDNAGTVEFKNSTGSWTGIGAGNSAFTYLFPSNATSTLLAFNGGLTAYASTTIGNGTATGGLTISGTATTTNLIFSGIKNALLGTNASGQVVSTTTIGTGLLTGTLATVNGTAITAGGSHTITAASSTLLANNNTFSGANTFSQTITGSISGNAGTVTNGVYTTTFNGLFDTRFVTQLAATTSVSSITTLPNLSLPYAQLTGTPAISGYPFALAGNATSTLTQFNGGLTAFASTTIGAGTQSGGLTVSGGATTTGNVYIAGTVGIGQDPTVNYLLGVAGTIGASNYKDINGSSYFLDPSAGSSSTVGGTSAILKGIVGIGTTSPYAALSIHASPSAVVATTLFAVASSTANATTTLFSITNAGSIFTMLADGCVQAASGVLTSTGSACGSGGGSAFSYLFPSNATSTKLSFTGGLLSTASTTIGAGTQAGGLTVSGGATTTGSAYVAGSVGIGTTSPVAKLAVDSGNLVVFGNRDTSGAGIDSFTQLMLHGDGTNGSITFTDSSANNFTATVNGNAQISTAQSKFGGASMAFDGTGDDIRIPDSANLEPGSGDFTIDFWVRFTSNADGQYLITKTGGYGSFGAYAFQTSSGNLVFYASAGASWNISGATVISSISTGTWYHVAVVRSGNNFYFFSNGALTSNTSASFTLQDNATTLSIGSYYGNGYFNGYIDEFRFSKGSARWTSAFTPPTSAYTSIAPTTTGFIGIGVASPLYPIQDASGAYLSIGGTWTNASDKNLKENFTDVDPSAVLDKITALPVTQWNYKVEGANVLHVGPTAQDFFAAFGLNNNDKAIASVDEAGIALAGIKGLSSRLESLTDAAFSASHATSTGTSTQSFAARFFGNLFDTVSAWLADATNGITDLFARRGHFADQLCVGSTCVTPEEFEALVAAANGPGSGGGASTASSVTCTLTAASSTVSVGEHTTLSWSAPSADTFTLDNGVGPVAPAIAGTTTSKAIVGDTTYVGTVTDPQGRVGRCSIDIRVNAPPAAPQNDEAAASSTPPTDTSNTTLISEPEEVASPVGESTPDASSAPSVDMASTSPSA